MDEPIGVLVVKAGRLRVACFPCVEPKALPVVYRGNIEPYKATCVECDKLLVAPLTPAWPELFS